jgi:cytochrome b subunit of formate dehydrogenase
MSASIGAGSGHAAAMPQARAGRYYRRFGPLERLMHAGLMFSFIGCALSGVPLLFPYAGWAKAIATVMGGFEGAALVHRVCAVVMITVFAAHIFQFLWRGLGQGSLLTVLWGPNSLVPQWKDVTDIYEHVKFFLGKGPRPKFDRYTYWEKFDYMAVFWGMFIIGGSGVLLWFFEPLSAWVPGWVFNIATLIHGHEALLAVGFIFTIHFFNGHLRIEKFPMDTVIFTGRVSEHELIDERPLEYERLVHEGRLQQIADTPPSPTTMLVARIVGGTGLALGLLTIFFMIYSLLAPHG